MENGATQFLEIMLRVENLLTMVGVWALVGTFGKMFPGFAKTPVGARLQPLAPLGVCQFVVWLPGLQPDDMGAGTRVMLALCLGFGAGHVHKILKQTVFGEDGRISGKDNET